MSADTGFSGIAPITSSPTQMASAGCWPPRKNKPVECSRRPSATVRAENPVHGSDQQSCASRRLAVMITDHVPAVRLPPDHASGRVAAAAAVCRETADTTDRHRQPAPAYDRVAGLPRLLQHPLAAPRLKRGRTVGPASGNLTSAYWIQVQRRDRSGVIHEYRKVA